MHSKHRTQAPDIATSRLLLRLMSPVVIAACISRDLQRASDLLGAHIPRDLLDDPRVLKFSQDRLNDDPGYAPWAARAIIAKDRRQMIGHIRFHTMPDPDYLRPYVRDAVELGYQVFPPYRRQGYANEAIHAAMGWAEAAHGVHRFVVSVSPSNHPSMALVARLGFAKIGEHLDEIDGVEHIFLRQ